MTINCEQEAKRIIALLKKDFLLPNGALCLERTPSGMFPHHIFPDLGDFLPFLIYFKEDVFVEEQINSYRKVIKDGILVSEFPTFKISNLAKSYEYTDLLLGLTSYYTYKKDEASRSLLVDAASKAEMMFDLGGNTSSFYHTKYKVRLPIVDTREGTFVEIFIDLARVLSDDHYLKVAHNIFNRLVSMPFYRTYGLLPTFHAPWWVRMMSGNDKRFKTAELCKNNTNSLFAFLALYKATQDENVLMHIENMVESVMTKAMIGGGIIKTFDPNDREVKDTFLTASFSMLDFLCDFYYVKKDQKYLVYAENIADYWLSLAGATGLFPVMSTGKETFVDSETDMTVALYKLFEITAKAKYREAALRCFEGIIKYHSLRDYPLGVSIDTGEVINPAQRTKFITLFLKLLIAKIHIEKGETIMSTPWLRDILNDR